MYKTLNLYHVVPLNIACINLDTGYIEVVTNHQTVFGSCA